MSPICATVHVTLRETIGVSHKPLVPARYG